MAIVQSSEAGASTAPATASGSIPPVATPGLFIKTILPAGAVSCALPCALFPPAVLSARLDALGHETSSFSTTRPHVLVTASPGAVVVYAVDCTTRALVEIDRIPVFGAVRALEKISAAACRGDGAPDVLLVLTDASQVSFIHFDALCGRVVCSGPCSLFGLPGALPDVKPREDARLLVSHPRRPLAAVATLESTVSVFPVLFMGEAVDAGKVASESVDGVVLSLTFLEDDGGPLGVLIALVQKKTEQEIAVFSVGALSADGGGLSITLIGSMGTCATRYDDIALARLQAKRTGGRLKPPPEADLVALVHGCPYLFTVCLEGRVAVADARSFVHDAVLCGETLLPSALASSKSRSDALLPLFQSRGYNRAPGDEEGPTGGSGAGNSGGIVVSVPGEHEPGVTGDPSGDPEGMQVDGFSGAGTDAVESDQNGDEIADLDGSENPTSANASAGAGTAALSTGADAFSGPDTAAPSTAGGEGWGAASWSAPSHTITGAQTDAGSASVSSPTEQSFAQDEEQIAGAPVGSSSSSPPGPEVTDDRPSVPTSGEPQHAGVATAAFEPATSRLFGTHRAKSSLDPLLVSQRYNPPHIALDIAGGCEGIATTVAQGGSHFGRGGSANVVDDADSGNGMYFVMESGRMFVLRWRRTLRRGGPPSFVIPTGSHGRHRAGDKCADSSPFFSLELVGDVGPASALAALDDGLLYVANDGADGSLRHVQPPESSPGAKYRLAVRQEFLNLAPISDFDFAKSMRKHRPTRRRNRPSASEGAGGFRPLRQSVSGGAPPHSGKAIESRVGSRDVYQDDPSNAPETMTPEPQERELVVGCGIGQHGTVRILKPGTHVSVYSSSKIGLQCCNGMWDIRLSRKARHHGLLVMTFPEFTGVFCIMPPGNASGDGPVARLVDGSDASGFLQSTRTLACGRVCDGLVAQVHRHGVRFIWLKKYARGSTPPFAEDSSGGRLLGSFVERSYDWNTADELYVSCACVGSGYVILSVMAPLQKPRLVVLEPSECVRGDESCVREVVSVGLEEEVSSLALPSWIDEDKSSLASSRQEISDVVLVTTYAPEVQVRNIRAGLDLLATLPIPSWPPLKPSESPGAAIAAGTSCKAESVCGVKYGSRFVVAVGLRDGAVVTFDLIENQGNAQSALAGMSMAASCPYRLELIGRRCIGMNPVRLSVVTVAFGKALLAESERPWLGSMLPSGAVSWAPLHFPETIAGTPLSVAGAERCLALVSSDNVLHICGVKRSTPVTVSTIRIGDTPRRVLPLGSPVRFVVVATSNNDAALPDCSAPQETAALTAYLRNEMSGSTSGIGRNGDDFGLSSGGMKSAKGAAGDTYDVAPRFLSDIRVYSSASKSLVCKGSLQRDELVHVLLCWRDFIVVGTSYELRKAYPGSEMRDSYERGTMPCIKGRLVLFSVKDVSRKRRDLVQCAEEVLPGAVLAGATNETEECLVVSCNEHIFVFSMTASRKGLFEVARTSTRMLVVAISIHQGLVCAADRKDSVAFYRIDARAGLLVRDRGDFRRRVVSDSVLVDDYTAIVTDRYGHLFSLAYDPREEFCLPKNVCDISDARVPSRLLRREKSNAAVPDFDETSGSIDSEGFCDSGSDGFLDEERVEALEQLIEESAPQNFGDVRENFGAGSIQSYEAYLRRGGLAQNERVNDSDVEMQDLGSGASIARRGSTNDSDVEGNECTGDVSLPNREENGSALRDICTGTREEGARRASVPDNPPDPEQSRQSDRANRSSDAVGNADSITPVREGASLRDSESSDARARQVANSPAASSRAVSAEAAYGTLQAREDAEVREGDAQHHFYECEETPSGGHGDNLGLADNVDSDEGNGVQRAAGGASEGALEGMEGRDGSEQNGAHGVAQDAPQEAVQQLSEGDSMEDEPVGVEGDEEGEEIEGDEVGDADEDDATDGEGSEVGEDQPPLPEVAAVGEPIEDAILLFHGRQPVQHHLVCNHSFNMHDTALRVRQGSFTRRESRLIAPALGAPQDAVCPSFWSGKRGCAIVGTLSGALVVAVPVCRDDMSLLCRLVKEIVAGSFWGCRPLGLGHASYQTVFGEPGKGTVDGDLLTMYLYLTPQQQARVAEAAGCSSLEERERLVDVIGDLCDRAM